MEPLSVVIPNRDGADLLAQTLPPLAAELAEPEHEIIVVDDASTDHSLEYLARQWPQVRAVALASNVGFGAACRHGFQVARHPLVLLLNSDMLVKAGAVAALSEHFAQQDVFAAGPAYVSPAAEGDRTAGAVRPQLGAPAGGGLFRRQVFIDLGGFDPLYRPFYFEDLDLGWNAWRAGWRILYDERVHFVHLESATIRKLYPPGYVRRIKARNRVLFGLKNFTSPRLRRRHARAVRRHIIADLLKRRDTASLFGWYDAWRRRDSAYAARRTTPAVRDNEAILRDSETDLAMLLAL